MAVISDKDEDGETRQLHLKEMKPEQNGSCNIVELDVSDMNKSSAVYGHHGSGLTIFTAGVFMIGEMAGSGILSLPYAMDGLGYMGLVILPVISLTGAYTGNVLSRCWLIVQDRYPSLRQNVRYPYPAIGEITFGKKGRVLTSLLINFGLLGGAIVLLILSADNIYSLLIHLAGVHIPFCLLLIILAILLCPITWFGTPKDFWPIAVGATVSTLIASFLVEAAIITDATSERHREPVRHSKASVIQFFTAIGTVSFAFGGHAAFPTFQNDMKDQTKFGSAVNFAFFMNFLIYMPTAVSGFFLYGNAVRPNVLDTLPASPLVQVVQILMTCHLLLSFIININPVLQEVEELLRIPPYFTWRRAVCRTGMVGFGLLVAESVPQFGGILSFFGGSCFITMGFICPPVFYLKLCGMKGSWEEIEVPLHTKVFLIEIAVVGCALALMTSYSSFFELVTPDAFSLPCYISFI